MSTHEHLPQLSRTLLFHASFPKLDVNRSIFVYLWLSESLCKFSLSAWWNLPSALRDWRLQLYLSTKLHREKLRRRWVTSVFCGFRRNFTKHRLRPASGEEVSITISLFWHLLINNVRVLSVLLGSFDKFKTFYIVCLSWMDSLFYQRVCLSTLPVRF